MDNRIIVLRYHEIALKGANRSWFEERLAINARKLLVRNLSRPGHPDPQVEAERGHSRILIQAEWNEITRETLSRVFGVENFSVVRQCETNLDALVKTALAEVEDYIARQGMPKRFRVATKRSEKALPETSPELDRIIGGNIHDRYPNLEVNLTDPQLTVGVEIRQKRSFVWSEKFAGPGGLPVGTHGGLLTLLSGGIDSPIAAIQVLKRGANASFIHFYGAPFVGEDALNKVKDLVRIINRYQPNPEPLFVVPFGKIQEKIALATDPKMRTILYRRMMMRISSEVGKKMNSHALVTGESLGQVASQTLENLTTVDRAATLPVLRPLITYDKGEIIAAAQRWGTFETSIRPAADCCTLFADRHPTTRANDAIILEQEAKFSVDEFVKEAQKGMEIHFGSGQVRTWSPPTISPSIV